MSTYDLGEIAFASGTDQPAVRSVPFILALMTKDSLALYARHGRDL
jgi:hypothetical protein